jgi:hypothetical protein
MASLLRRLENIYIQNQLGTLSEKGWQSRHAMFSVIANSQGYSAYLDSQMAAFLNEDFAEYMTRLNTAK